MRLSIQTWDGNAINDWNGTTGNYEAVIPPGQTMPTASPEFTSRGQTWPYLAGKSINGSIFTFKIFMHGTLHSQLESLKNLFRTDDYTFRKLVAYDIADSNRAWYVEGFPVTPPTYSQSEGGTELVVQLALKDPLWRENVQQSDAWSITATGQTQTITTRGNYPALPVFEIKPTSVRTAGNGYTYKLFKAVYNPTANPMPNYPFAIPIDTAALVAGGKMQADGDDLRVMVDGIEIDRWLYNMNNAGTLVWININLKAKIELTISTAISNVGTPTTIDFAATSANDAALAKLPSTGILLIDSELFTYSAVNTAKRQVTVKERASKGTYAASHTTGATCRWIEHDLWLYYGNSTVTARTTDDTKKPIIDLDVNSSNTAWKYSAFKDGAGLRSGIWTSAVLAGATSNQGVVYNGNQGTLIADPSTEAGGQINAYKKSNTWKAGNATVAWQLAHPAGITHITGNAEKYRKTTSWPTVAVQYSNDGVNWTAAVTLATPASALTWTAEAIGSTALGATYNYVRFVITGSVAATASNSASAELNDFTVTLDSAKVPQIASGPAEIANYYHECTITNNTTGDAISIVFVSQVNKTIYVDCDAQTILADDGTPILAALSWNGKRQEWMTLAAGANTLQYNETGVQAVTFTTKWYARNLV